MNDNSCLIIIDVQNGVFKLKQSVYNRDNLIANLKVAIEAAKKNNILIVYTQHENTSFLLNGSEAWEIIDDIMPTGKNDLIIHKKHPSIFIETNLRSILETEGINRLYIAGLVSNGCIKEACIGGQKENFDIVLISDAHSTFYKNAEKIIGNINQELEAQGITLKKASDLW